MNDLVIWGQVALASLLHLFKIQKLGISHWWRMPPVSILPSHNLIHDIGHFVHEWLSVHSILQLGRWFAVSSRVPRVFRDRAARLTWPLIMKYVHDEVHAFQ